MADPKKGFSDMKDKTHRRDAERERRKAQDLPQRAQRKMGSHEERRTGAFKEARIRKLATTQLTKSKLWVSYCRPDRKPNGNKRKTHPPRLAGKGGRPCGETRADPSPAFGELGMTDQR
jgi:hypothetical protein